MWPDFAKMKDDPRGSKDLGDGYLLLGPKDANPHHTSTIEQKALNTFFSNLSGAEDIEWQSVYRWGRLKIPNEQITRSRWKELERCSDMARTDRNVKVCDSILSGFPLTY